jgi:hypothetical protein
MRALDGVRLAALEGDVDVVGLITHHGESMILAVALATGLTVEQIEAGDVDAFAELLAVVLEVNADFFAKRVVPRLGRLSLTSLGAGLTPSNS